MALSAASSAASRGNSHALRHEQATMARDMRSTLDVGHSVRRHRRKQKMSAVKAAASISRRCGTQPHHGKAATSHGRWRMTISISDEPGDIPYQRRYDAISCNASGGFATDKHFIRALTTASPPYRHGGRMLAKPAGGNGKLPWRRHIAAWPIAYRP